MTDTLPYFSYPQEYYLESPNKIEYSLPIINGLYSRYEADNFDITTNTWYDSGPNKNNILIFGSPSISGEYVNNGANKGFNSIIFNTTTTCNITNEDINNNGFTLFHVCRYQTTGLKKRIITKGTNSNYVDDFISGFDNNKSGIAYHNGWTTDNTTSVHNSNWVISCHYPQDYRSNGISRKIFPYGDCTLCQLTINGNISYASNCQVAEIIIYNRNLSISEIHSVEYYLENRYGIPVHNTHFPFNNTIRYAETLCGYGVSADYVISGYEAQNYSIQLKQPTMTICDSTNSYYFINYLTNQICKIDNSTNIINVMTDKINMPKSIAVSNDNTLFVIDRFNDIWKLCPRTSFTTDTSLIMFFPFNYSDTNHLTISSPINRTPAIIYNNADISINIFTNNPHFNNGSLMLANTTNQLNAQSQFITLPSLTNSSTGLSISLWFKLLSINNSMPNYNYKGTILYSFYNIVNNNFIQLDAYIQTSDGYNYQVTYEYFYSYKRTDSSTFRTISISNTDSTYINIADWNHIVWTISAPNNYTWDSVDTNSYNSTWNIYTNGMLTTYNYDASYNIRNINYNNNYIGYVFSNTSQYSSINAVLNDFRIFNAEISRTQVQELYSQTFIYDASNITSNDSLSILNSQKIVTVYNPSFLNSFIRPIFFLPFNNDLQNYNTGFSLSSDATFTINNENTGFIPNLFGYQLKLLPTDYVDLSCNEKNPFNSLTEGTISMWVNFNNSDYISISSLSSRPTYHLFNHNYNNNHFNLYVQSGVLYFTMNNLTVKTDFSPATGDFVDSNIIDSEGISRLVHTSYNYHFVVTFTLAPDPSCNIYINKYTPIPMADNNGVVFRTRAEQIDTLIYEPPVLVINKQNNYIPNNDYSYIGQISTEQQNNVQNTVLYNFAIFDKFLTQTQIQDMLTDMNLFPNYITSKQYMINDKQSNIYFMNNNNLNYFSGNQNINVENFLPNQVNIPSDYNFTLNSISCMTTDFLNNLYISDISNNNIIKYAPNNVNDPSNGNWSTFMQFDPSFSNFITGMSVDNDNLYLSLTNQIYDMYEGYYPSQVIKYELTHNYNIEKIMGTSTEQFIENNNYVGPYASLNYQPFQCYEEFIDGSYTNLSYISHMMFDYSNNLILSDMYNNRIRKLYLQNPVLPLKSTKIVDKFIYNSQSIISGNQYLSLMPFTNSIVGNGFTITFWLKTPGNCNGSHIIDFANDHNQKKSFVIGIKDGYLCVIITNVFNEIETGFYKICPVSDNVWRHFVIIFSNTSVLTVFVNGNIYSMHSTKIFGSFNLLNSYVTHCPEIDLRTYNFIGKSNTYSNPLFTGNIKGFEIYNYELTCDDAIVLYDRSGLILHYTFDNEGIYEDGVMANVGQNAIVQNNELTKITDKPLLVYFTFNQGTSIGSKILSETSGINTTMFYRIGQVTNKGQEFIQKFGDVSFNSIVGSSSLFLNGNEFLRMNESNMITMTYNDGITFGFWFKINEVTPSTIFNFGTNNKYHGKTKLSNIPSKQIYVKIQNNKYQCAPNQFYLSCNVNGTICEVFASDNFTKFTTGVWYHFMLTQNYSSDNPYTNPYTNVNIIYYQFVYINGTIVNILTELGDINFGNQFYLSNYDFVNNYFGNAINPFDNETLYKGYLSDFRLYNNYLTSEEISNIFTYNRRMLPEIKDSTSLVINGFKLTNGSMKLKSQHGEHLSIPSFIMSKHGFTFAFWIKMDSLVINKPLYSIFEFGGINDLDSIGATLVLNQTNNGYYVKLHMRINNVLFYVITNVVLPHGYDNNGTDTAAWKHIVWTINTDGKWEIYENNVLINTYYPLDKLIISYTQYVTEATIMQEFVENPNKTIYNYPKSFLNNDFVCFNNFIGYSKLYNDVYFDGYLCDFRVYNKVLIPLQINAIYINKSFISGGFTYNNSDVNLISPNVLKNYDGKMLTIMSYNKTNGYSGDNQYVLNTRFNKPSEIVIDKYENTYITDTYNHRIRKIDVSGIITTICGNGTAKSDFDSTLAINATCNMPYGIVIDKNGDIIFTECFIGGKVRKINQKTGILYTLTNYTNLPQALTIDSYNNIYYNNLGDYTIRKFNNNTGIAEIIYTDTALLSSCYSLCCNSIGYVYFTSSKIGLVKCIDTRNNNNVIHIAGRYNANIVSGDGGFAKTATFKQPYGIAVDNNDNIYVSDCSANIIRFISKNGYIRTLAGRLDGSANYYGSTSSLHSYLNSPQNLYLYSDKNSLYIIENSNFSIKKMCIDNVDIFSSTKNSDFTQTIVKAIPITGYTFNNNTVIEPFVTWNMSASSEDPSHNAFNAFTDTSNCWSPTNLYVTYNKDGSYAGNNNTVINNGLTISGEWLQIQLPDNLSLTSYSFTMNKNFYKDNSNCFTREPTSWYLLGSDDGNLWNTIDSVTNYSPYYECETRYFDLNVLSVKPSYSYFRWIPTTITPLDCRIYLPFDTNYNNYWAVFSSQSDESDSVGITYTGDVILQSNTYMVGSNCLGINKNNGLTKGNLKIPYFSTSNNFSGAFWIFLSAFNPVSPTNPNFNKIINFDISHNSQIYFDISVNTISGKDNINFQTNVFSTILSVTNVPIKEQWTHVAYTVKNDMNSATMTIYINGGNANGGSIYSNQIIGDFSMFNNLYFNNTTPICNIGNSSKIQFYMDDFRYFDGILSQNNISGLFQNKGPLLNAISPITANISLNGIFGTYTLSNYYGNMQKNNGLNGFNNFNYTLPTTINIFLRESFNQYSFNTNFAFKDTQIYSNNQPILDFSKQVEPVIIEAAPIVGVDFTSNTSTVVTQPWGYTDSINISWIVSSSTDDNVNLAYNAFNNGNDYWASGNLCYNNTNKSSNSYTSNIITPVIIGGYGSYNTADNLTSTQIIGASGEWLQIQLPDYFKLTQYVLQSPFLNISNNSSDIISEPISWIVVGSNDGIQWILIDSQTNIIPNLPSTERVFKTNCGDYYSYYRIIIQKTYTNIVGTSQVPTQVFISKWALYGIYERLLLNTQNFISPKIHKLLPCGQDFTNRYLSDNNIDIGYSITSSSSFYDSVNNKTYAPWFGFSNHTDSQYLNFVNSFNMWKTANTSYRAGMYEGNYRTEFYGNACITPTSGFQLNNINITPGPGKIAISNDKIIIVDASNCKTVYWAYLDSITTLNTVNLTSLGLTESSYIYSPVISFDGNILVLTLRNDFCYYSTWNGSNFGPFKKINIPSGKDTFTCGCFSNSNRLVVCTKSGSIYFMDWNNDGFGNSYKIKWINPRHVSYYGIAISQDNEHLVISSEYDYSYWFYWNGLNYIGNMPIGKKTRNALPRFSKDKKMIYFTSFDGTSYYVTYDSKLNTYVNAREFYTLFDASSNRINITSNNYFSKLSPCGMDITPCGRYLFITTHIPNFYNSMNSVYAKFSQNLLPAVTSTTNIISSSQEVSVLDDYLLTVVELGIASGEWIQAEFSKQIKMTGFTFYPLVNNTSDFYIHRWYVLGSNDGEKWFLIGCDEKISINNMPRTFIMTGEYCNNYFYYIRFVINSTCGNINNFMGGFDIHGTF